MTQYDTHLTDNHNNTDNNKPRHLNVVNTTNVPSSKRPKTTGLVPGTVCKNASGGVYKCSKAYQLQDKDQVAKIYDKHLMEAYPGELNLTKVAKEAQVSQMLLKNFVEELHEDSIVDPDVERKKGKSTGVCGFLDIAHELLRLGSYAENPARSNIGLLQQSVRVILASSLVFSVCCFANFASSFLSSSFMQGLTVFCKSLLDFFNAVLLR
jgi:hypothetical protein